MIEGSGGAIVTGKAPRIALIHDFLLDLRGAERVFLELCALWPEADIFTTVYDEHGTEGRFARRGVHTSFLQRLGPSARTFRPLLPLYPAAIESLRAVRLRPRRVEFVRVGARGAVRAADGARELLPQPVPLRLEQPRSDALAPPRSRHTRAAAEGFSRWRQWDWIAAQRVDRYLANSQVTQARIRAYFGRESRVVYPPVATHRFAPGPVGEHYAVVSELMPTRGSRWRSTRSTCSGCR